MQERGAMQDRGKSSVKKKLPINVFYHNKKGGDCVEDVHHQS